MRKYASSITIMAGWGFKDTNGSQDLCERSQIVSSGDTAVVSTHQSMTQSPPWGVRIVGGGGVFWTKVCKSSMRSSNREWQVGGFWTKALHEKFQFPILGILEHFSPIRSSLASHTVSHTVETRKSNSGTKVNGSPFPRYKVFWKDVLLWN